jgi:thiol:disulfide interchange protein
MSPRGLGLLLLWGLCLLASPGWASSLDWLSQGRSLLDGGLGSAASAPASPVLGKRPVFLPVEQAFVVQGRQEGESLLLSVTVTPGHYVYQQRFALTPSAGVRLGPLQYSRAPVFVDDPDFGRVPVFDQSVEVRATVQGQGEVGYRWQGCAKAGL